MWTLKDYRDTYGDQLKDYSDLEIADAVRQQQHPDMPAADFYKAFGMDSGRGAVGRGLAKGIQQNIGAIVEGVPAIYKSLTGDEEGARQSLEAFRSRLAETEARNPTAVQDFTQIPKGGVGETLSRAGSYVGESFGQLFPSLAMVMAGGLTGGAAGVAAGVGAGLGRAAGATAAGMALNTSESFATLAADGEQRAGEALVAGTIKSALDALPAVQMLRRGAGELGERAVEAASARIARRFGVGTAKDAGLEGLTEGAQSFVDQTAERLVGLSDSYDFVGMIDSGIRGAIGAGPLAAVGEARGRSVDRQFVAADEARAEAENEKVAAANAEAERLLTAQRQREDAEGQQALFDELGPKVSNVPEDLLRRGDELNRAQLSLESEFARTEDQTSRQVPARIDQPGIGLDPEQVAQQTRAAATEGQPYGAAGQNRDTDSSSAINTEPQFVVDSQGIAREAVVLPPDGTDSIIPPTGRRPTGGMPPRPRGPVTDADFEVLSQLLLEGPATPDTATQATTTLNAQAQAAAAGIAELAPDLAADVEAMLGTVTEQQTQQAAAQTTAQVAEKAAAQTRAQELQQKLDTKLAGAKGPVASEVQAAGPARAIGTVADAVVFEAGGNLYRTPVGSNAKIIRLKGTPPGFKPFEAQAPVATADMPTPSLVEQLTMPATAAPAQQREQSVVTAPQELAPVNNQPVSPPEGQEVADSVQTPVTPSDDKPRAVKQQTDAADKILRNLTERRASLQSKLFDRKTKPAEKDALRAELATTATAIKKRQDAIAKKAAASEEPVDVLEDEAPTQPEAQAEETTADAAEVPVDVQVEMSDVAPQAEAIAAELAERLYEMSEQLPERFTAAEAAALGIPDSLVQALTPADGTYARDDLQDLVGLSAETVPQAQPSPTGLLPGEALVGEIMEIVRKINPGTILAFDPSMKWGGLAWNDKVLMGQKGTREQQILTAYHEVGGHALGHMGKLSRVEAKYIESAKGQQALLNIVKQAIRDGHPTLSVHGLSKIREHISKHGYTETLAFAVEAAAWYQMNGRPLPSTPTGLRGFINRAIAAMSALVEAWGQPWLADVIGAVGLAREHNYLAGILSGRFGKRSKGKYPPIGATTSVFSAELGYAEQRYTEIADAILTAENAYLRALAAGNTSYAQQLAARMAQLREEANHVEAQPSPSVQASNESMTEAALENERARDKSVKMEAETPDRLPWYMKAASPAFVAQMRPKLKPLFAAIQNILVPINIELENSNRVVDIALAKAKDADVKAVTRLMEATNSARLDPIIDAQAGSVTFTVPDYADYMLTKAGLRHKIFMSKPGETIKLTGAAYELYRTLSDQQDTLRIRHVNSLLARAGLPNMALGPNSTDADLDAQIAKAREIIEQSDDTTAAKNTKIGALAAAARAFEERVGGYMPMVRSGDWLVRMTVGDSKSVKTADQRERVFAFNNEREARAFAEKQRRENAGWEARVVANQRFNDQMLRSGNLEDALDATSIVLSNALSGQKGNQKIDEALQILGATIGKAKLDVSVRGLRQRNIKRRDIAGHIKPDENGAYLAASVRPYLSQMATQISYNVAHPSIIEAMKGLPPDLAGYGQTAIVDAYLAPELWPARIKAMSFAWTLGMNVSSMLLNLPQLVLTTAPTLGSMFGSVRAWSEMRKAFVTSVKQLPANMKFLDPTTPAFFDPSKQWEGLTSDEQNFMSLALQYGLIDQGLATETSGLISAEDVRSRTIQKATRYLGKGVNFMGKMFGLSEQLNRSTTLLAAYRMAKTADPKKLEAYMKRGYTGDAQALRPFEGDKAARFAISVMQQTQGVFNKSNRPVWMQGWMGIPTQFMQFPLFMMETIAGAFLKDAEGKRWASSKEGTKFLGHMFAGLWALGGVMAFPMAESADELLKKLTEFLSPLGVPKVDFEKAFRAGIAEVAQGLGFDENTSLKIGEAAARGLSRTANIDISRRVAIDLGLADLLFNADPTNYLGPMGSITIGSVLAARDMVREGNDTLAILQFMPVFARNLARGDILAGGVSEELGVSPRGGGDIIGRAGVGLSGAGKASAGEALTAAIGFTPTRVARERERVEEARSEGSKDRRERVVNLAADYLFFAQKAQEAGRAEEAADYRRRFQREVQNAVEADKSAKDPTFRIIKDADSFRTAIAQRLEQRRSGQLGPAGAARGKTAQYYAQERASDWVPK
jgi:hypothetical protein